MGLWFEIRRRLNDAVFPGIVVMLTAYFGYHATQGDLGLISYLHLTKQIEELEIKAADTAAARAELEHRVALISPVGGVDPDLLDEKARYVLGFAHPDDIVIFMATED